MELPGAQVARALARVGGELARSTEHGEPSRFFWSLALSDEVAFGDDITIFAAGRASGVTGQGVALLPRAGLRWEPAEGWALRLALGRSLRTPTIDELYRPAEAGFSGNPALIAETSWEAEVGATYGGEHLRAGASVFGRSISDVILYVNRNAFEVRPENLGDARALGGELELDAGGAIGIVRLGGFASFGLLLSELVETGERLPTQPVWSSASQVDIAVGPVALFSAVRWFGPTSTRLGSDRPETRVPAYVRWDAGLEVRPQDWFSAAFRATNLLDDRGLQSVNKIPLPGRAFFVTLSVSTEGS
jgi:outer membrane receptor protein involved in Fe transport